MYIRGVYNQSKLLPHFLPLPCTLQEDQKNTRERKSQMEFEMDYFMHKNGKKKAEITINLKADFPFYISPKTIAQKCH